MDNQNKAAIVADENDVQQNKVLAALAYVLFIVPLIVSKDSPFTRYHLNQGIWLFLISVFGYIIISILSVAVIGLCLFPVFVTASLVYMVLGIINAVNGKMEPLPGFASLPAIIK